MLSVAIVDLLGSPYDDSTADKRGLGGSESAVIFIARELVKLGIRVDVYNDCNSKDAKPGYYSYSGVTYRTISSIPIRSECYDIVISSRSVLPHISTTDYYLMGNKRILWMHDTFCQGDDLIERMVVNDEIDEIWTLSDWHTTYVSQCNHGHRRMMEVLKRKIWVTRNGVNIYDHEVDYQQKNLHRFVYNASVSKGMETLLKDIWPRIYNGINSLTIIGGAYPLKQADAQNVRLLELMDEHEGKNGVTFTGIISQKEVAYILADAGYMIYPQSFPETFGISTVESLAYGTPVISGRFGAMEETAIEAGSYLIDYPVDSNVLYSFNKEAHVEAFVKNVDKATQDYYFWQQKSNAALAVREVCGWDKVALQWKQHLFHITGNYLPVEEYREVTKINHRTHKIFGKRWSNPEEWGSFNEYEKMIHVIVPFYNASQYLSRCVESIKAQNYDAYRVYLIDDASTDDPDATQYECDNIRAFINIKNVGALENQVDAIEEYIIKHDYDDIIMLIDGDDALVNDPNIFKRINQLYHEGAEFTYGSCWSLADNIPLVAQEYPKDVILNKTFKDHKFPWNIPYTHLRTFSWDLYSRVDYNDLVDSNVNFYKAGGDAALFYALIDKAKPEGIRCVRDIMYLYNDLNPINDYKVHAEEQTKNANEIMQKKKVLIAIPTAQNIHPQTFKSIYDLEVPDGYEADFQFFYGYCVDQVRNLIADWVVRGYDYLFAVDYDISFEPDTLKKLLEADKDIVSGLYIQRIPGQHKVEVYRSTITGAQYNVPIDDLLNKKDHLQLIDGCGFGCVLVKREVFESVGYPYFTYHHAIKMEDTVSEDVDFCNKARANGFRIYANTTIKCRHHGQTEFLV